MRFRITSEYGVLEEVRQGAHTGIDLAMPSGTELRSLMNGTVEKVFDNSGAIGNGVMIKTDDGKELIYGHMDKVDVNAGDQVNAGELIGLSGNTGNSTGPHLHFGMKENGSFIDPSEHVDKLDSMLGPVGHLLYNPIKDQVSENTKEFIIGVLEGILELVVDSIGAITLIGTTVLIIMRIAGFDKGYKWAGILFSSNILIKYLLGGYQS